MATSQEMMPNDDFYRLHGPYNEIYLIQFIGLIISELKVENFEETKRKWTFTIMQVDNHSMNVEFVSTCPEDELRLHRLFKAEGSIIYSNNAYVREFDRTIVILNDAELMLFAMRPTVAQIKRFLKEYL